MQAYYLTILCQKARYRGNGWTYGHATTWGLGSSGPGWFPRSIGAIYRSVAHQ